MKKREPIAVVLLSIVTCSIYWLYWLVKTKGELNKANQDNPKIPTAFFWLIPFVGTILWYWKYAGGAEKYTGGKCSQAIGFILLFLLGPIGGAIIQNYFNQSAVAAPAQPVAPEQPGAPENQQFQQ